MQPTSNCAQGYVHFLIEHVTRIAGAARRPHPAVICTFVLCLAFGCLRLFSNTPRGSAAGNGVAWAAAATPTPLNLTQLNCSQPPANVTFQPISATIVLPVATPSPQSGGEAVQGTIDCNGNIAIKSGAITFPSSEDYGTTSQLRLYDDVTGNINPNTGEATRTYKLRLYLSGTYAAIPPKAVPPGCYVGDIQWNMSTTKTGGKAYSTADGSATLSDPAWTAPALVQGSDNYHNCGKDFAAFANKNLGLPWTASTVSMSKVIPVVVRTFEEKEPNDQLQPNMVAIPNIIFGSFGTSNDTDYYQVVIPKGKSVLIEHVTSYTRAETVECSTGKVTKTKTTYAGPVLNMFGDTSYQIGSEPPTYGEGNCGDRSAGARRRGGRRRQPDANRPINDEPPTTSQETVYYKYNYSNSIQRGNTTSADMPLTFYIFHNSTISGFPQTGTYTLTVTLK